MRSDPNEDIEDIDISLEAMFADKVIVEDGPVGIFTLCKPV